MAILNEELRKRQIVRLMSKNTEAEDTGRNEDKGLEYAHSVHCTAAFPGYQFDQIKKQRFP